jgi:hypothetical protein
MREFHFGDNLTGSNLKDCLDGVDWRQATQRVDSLNPIATLVFHVNYYIAGVLQVLRGGPLDIRDRYSFDCPPIEAEADWAKLKEKAWADAEAIARLIEELPERRLAETFVDEKYGDYARNLQGLIEHSYYHLGQIALIRKLLGD